MGHLIYANQEIAFDDRVLAHLQIVIVAKLRRHEPLTLSWAVPRGDDSGRMTIWISESIPLQFSYEATGIQINPAWVELLTMRANSPSGLAVVPEP